MDNKKLIVIDGNSLVNRAYYALRNPMMTKDGTYTHAIYGFVNILNKIMTDHSPGYMVIAFDLKAPTFRHKQYEEYKAGRKKMPPELAMQIPILKELLDAMNISRLEMEGFEADDLIGTVARRAEADGFEPLIITGDKDELQLVTDITKVMLTRKGISEFDLFDSDAMYEKYGFTATQFIDYKGLVGDSSDNIPGVPGVGDKTGTNLIKEFGSLENVIARAGEIKSTSLRKKIEEYSQQALMSKMLATINTAVPIGFEIEDFKLKEPDYTKLVEMYTRLEFRSFLAKLKIDGNPLSESERDSDGGRGATKIDEALVGIKVNLISSSSEIFALQERMKLKTEHAIAANEDSPELVIKLFSDNNHRNTPLIEGAALLFEDDYYYIDLSGGDEAISEALAAVILSGLPLVGHGLGKDYYSILACGFDLRIGAEGNDRIFNTKFDTEIAQYVIDPGSSSYSLKTLVYEYLGEEIADEETLFKGREQISLLDDNREIYAEYGKKHCVAVKLLAAHLQKELEEKQLFAICKDMEFPLIEVLASMECVGFSASAEKLSEIGRELDVRIVKLTEKIYEQAGGEFNINSTKQLSKVLFEDLGLPPAKKTKTGYSTDVEVLEGLRGAHEIIDLILDYRSLTKLNSTYVLGLMPTIAADGRIHPHFKQSGAATGRISCNDPNLQNIPIKQDEGRRIRGAFFAGDGKKLVGADYSQIELRVLAHMSSDERLCSAFNAGEDIHTSTASAVFNIEKGEVSRRQRSDAKAVNFGVVYGMSPFGLSKELGISVKKAEKYISSYFENHQAVRIFLDSQIAFAKENGYVETMLGRRRYIPELGARQVNVRNYGERLAMNTPIQGTAADIIKLAMNAVYDELRNSGVEAELLLQIHDELIVEVSDKDVQRVAAILERVMAGVLELCVALETDISVSDNWEELK